VGQLGFKRFGEDFITSRTFRCIRGFGLTDVDDIVELLLFVRGTFNVHFGELVHLFNQGGLEVFEISSLDVELVLILLDCQLEGLRILADRVVLEELHLHEQELVEYFP